MSRTPPVEVRRALRREVGFGCPVDGCGNPYLHWHHFDPPWNVRQHHEPEGMIALCGEHHAKADAGAYTVEQFRAFKDVRADAVAGRFEWLRHELLLVVGGNFHLRTPVAVQFREQPVIALTRDSDGHALLNVNMLSRSPEPRMIMHEGFWLSLGDPEDLECPPSGRLVSVRYPGGDALRVEFFELQDDTAFGARYPDADWPIPFPITAVEVQMRVGGTEVDFGPKESRLPGGNVFRGNFIKDAEAGIVLR